MSQGILNEKGEIVRKAMSDDKLVVEGDGYSDDVYNFGWMMICPAYYGAKPQAPLTEIAKRKKNKKGRT